VEVFKRLSLEDARKRGGPGSAQGRMTAIAACRTCGAEHLENARFCHGCGSPVQDGDTRAEYKQVTVLFADVVHSMEIAAAVGAERLREIMTDLVDRASTVVQRYGGTVDKFTGDGIMAVFGAPMALEDHAIRACLAALGIQEGTKRLAVDVHARDGVDLQLRVGLNSGQVIAGEIGSGPFGYTAVGEQVGMAQRRESVAPPGGVMLSASTARLVGLIRAGCDVVTVQRALAHSSAAITLTTYSHLWPDANDRTRKAAGGADRGVARSCCGPAAD
jgi:class 3 adenylate cyclase